MTNDMATLHLLARIGGERVALPATAVESVIEVEALTPVPRVGRHIAGLAPLRSRVLTIVDTAVSLDLAPGEAGEARPAVVVAVDGHSYGLLVDSVEDVVACPAAPRPLARGHAAGWARAAVGTIEHEGEAVLLLEPAAIVAGPSAA